MKVPVGYYKIPEGLPAEVSFGCGGIRLFAAAEIEKGQVGYSVAPDGSSLCSDEDGAWRSNWLVIGYETGCGDPLFIDTNVTVTPVFTAMHGQGAWKPVQVAASVEAFAKCINEFSRIAMRRSNPVERENNPVGDSERRSFLRRVADLNQASSAPEFWEVLLEF